MVAPNLAANPYAGVPRSQSVQLHPQNFHQGNFGMVNNFTESIGQQHPTAYMSHGMAQNQSHAGSEEQNQYHQFYNGHAA
ncbi:MAG: hypothetical protein ACK521_00250 [bacterium]|jgi:hypothetical protein